MLEDYERGWLAPVRSGVFAGSLRGALRDSLDQPGANRVKLRELAEIGGNVLGDLNGG